ncbi:DUF559 domain-containing protein [Rhodococcus sp. ABRD24]|uniref:DUF559 domain-containing protein n=1 Tax=Rhodococcus sp. ABRD24 TaxID=2507582 RepID=UPI00103CA133|nr:DUF559 domain-containing protein [Rhodococcus sp. ABRD24]QBJ97656.1 DUF559 domain-containing protein [Rhodococcus sp. ABRD24]
MQPFRGSRAVADGTVTVHHLRHDFTRIYRDVYVPRGTAVTPRVRAQAAWIFAGSATVLTGYSAAALHGARWIDTTAPAEVICHGHRRAPAGLLIHNCHLDADEVCTVDGMCVATPARAAFDLGRRLPRRDAISALDDLCRNSGLSVEDIELIAKRHPRTPGAVRLRRYLPDVDAGSESPPETHTRLVIVDAGLPRPETQVPLVAYGREFAWADMGWRRWSVLVEYDGEHHWTDRRQRAWDIERAARIEKLGFTVVRVGSELLYNRPGTLVTRVREKLREAGAPI